MRLLPVLLYPFQISLVVSEILSEERKCTHGLLLVTIHEVVHPVESLMIVKFHDVIERLVLLDNPSSNISQSFLVEPLPLCKLRNLDIHRCSSRTQRLDVRTELQFHGTTPPFILEVI